MRICSTHTSLIEKQLKSHRFALEAYIGRHREFFTSVTPVHLLPGAPVVARRMARAADAVGVGPMAAVAGVMAHLGVEAAVESGAREAIVENGGDVVVLSPEHILVGLYAGGHSLSGRMALRLEPSASPLAICSSSSIMGHSRSFGSCDLATIVAADGGIADAAATLACNLVRKPKDVEKALQRVLSIRGVEGVLIIKGEDVGLAGDLPRLVRHDDASMKQKVSHDARSGYFDSSSHRSPR